MVTAALIVCAVIVGWYARGLWGMRSVYELVRDARQNLVDAEAFHESTRARCAGLMAHGDALVRQAQALRDSVARHGSSTS